VPVRRGDLLLLSCDNAPQPMLALRTMMQHCNSPSHSSFRYADEWQYAAPSLRMHKALFFIDL
jgi:hypothetical protein